MKYSVSRTLIYFLIFTTVASLVAYKLIIKGYDTTFETYANALQ
jgi:hypothetical protein